MKWHMIRQLAILLVIFEIACTSSGPSKQEQDKDTVTPKTVDVDLTKLPKSTPWKPGDPVREMPDLKQTPPVGEQQVAPTLYEGRLQEITQATLAGLWSDTTSACNKAGKDESFLRHAPEKNISLLARLVSSHSQEAEPTLCIAVNRGDDALAGGWYLYKFKIPVATTTAQTTLDSVTLTETYCELILRSADSLRTYQVALSDLQKGKPSNLAVKQTSGD